MEREKCWEIHGHGEKMLENAGKFHFSTLRYSKSISNCLFIYILIVNACVGDLEI